MKACKEEGCCSIAFAGHEGVETIANSTEGESASTGTCGEPAPTTSATEKGSKTGWTCAPSAER